MKKIIGTFFLLMLLSQIVWAQVPTISDFNPKFGPVGTTVTITGTNFSTTAANNIVYFGAVRATVTAATSTSLSVTVPIGATFQPITVTTNELTAYSSKPFIVTFAGGGTITSNSFSTKVDFAAGSNAPLSVAIGDLDGDGKSDLVVANYNTFSVFRNMSTSGSITSNSFDTRVDFATSMGCACISIGDLNGDGKPELITTNGWWGSSTNTISVFRNTSTSGSITSNSFAAKVDFATGNLPINVAIGDFDGDGKPDLVVENNNSNTVSAFQNTSTSDSISFSPKVDFIVGNNPCGVAIGDFDGDGKPDLVTANSGFGAGNTISVLRNTSTSGSISFSAKVDFTAGGMNPGGVAIGDFDGDGKPDLAVTHLDSSRTVSVFRNTSTSGSITSSSFAANVDFTTGSYPWGVAVGDLDGDGKPDIAIENQQSKTISVLRNTSTSGSITSSSFAAKVDFATDSVPMINVAIGDLDGDGKPDLIVANNGSNTVSVLRSNTSRVRLSADTVSFGSIKIDQFKDTTITFTNIGNDTLKISNINSSNPIFSARPTSMNLAPGQSFTDTLRFAPAAIVSTSGTMQVSSNALFSPDTIRVTGTGFGTAVIQLSTNTVSFPSIKLGQFKDTTVTLSNAGDDTLKITNIISTMSYFSVWPTTLTIPPGQSKMDTIRFVSDSIGVRSGLIFLTSNAVSSPDTITVTGNGITTGVARFCSEIPESYVLFQNYPNPFNPATTIKYQIPKSNHVTLKVFDIMGRVVATLIDGFETPGYKDVQFNTNGLASGVYFYRLEAGSFTQTKKLLFLK